MWFLAPPRACTRLPARVPVSYTWRATAVLPTKDTASTSGCSSRAPTASASPWSTVNVPSGNPARCTRSASISDAEGSFSDGLSTKAFPHASALASIHSGTITGKLNGVMPATTPTGWSTVWTSTPPDTSAEWAPLSRWGMPQANSTLSRPRATSPCASDATLPCSRVTMAASSSRSACSSSRSRNSIPARRPDGDSPQAAAASTASLTAPSTSAADASATSAVCTPRAGSKTGAVRPEEPATARPPIQWPMASIRAGRAGGRSRP